VPQSSFFKLKTSRRLSAFSKKLTESETNFNIVFSLPISQPLILTVFCLKVRVKYILIEAFIVKNDIITTI
jgi:hypothetical protein